MRTKKVKDQEVVDEIVEETLVTMTKEGNTLTKQEEETFDKIVSAVTEDDAHVKIDTADIDRLVSAIKVPDEEVPVTWESEIRKQVMEFVDNMLVVAQECNMGTIYIKPVKAQYEGYAEYDEGKASGAELRLVFKFVEPIDLSKVNLV